MNFVPNTKMMQLRKKKTQGKQAFTELQGAFSISSHNVVSTLLVSINGAVVMRRKDRMFWLLRAALRGAVSASKTGEVFESLMSLVPATYNPFFDGTILLHLGEFVHMCITFFRHHPVNISVLQVSRYNCYVTAFHSTVMFQRFMRQ